MEGAEERPVEVDNLEVAVWNLFFRGKLHSVAGVLLFRNKLVVIRELVDVSMCFVVSSQALKKYTPASLEKC